MKRVLPFMLLIAGAGLVQASIVETIDFDLSPLNAGSMLSGTFTLSDTPAVGDTAPVVLTFSDPSDYTPTSLAATISVDIGRFNPFSVSFSDLIFTNLNGSTSPTLPKNVDLFTGFPGSLPYANFATCASFPCTATGVFSDINGTTFSVLFTSTYTIAPVPEPSYAFAAPILLAAIFFGRRFVYPATTSRS